MSVSADTDSGYGVFVSTAYQSLDLTEGESYEYRLTIGDETIGSGRFTYLRDDKIPSKDGYVKVNGDVLVQLGDRSFASLSAAIEAAPSGSTLTLQKDSDEPFEVSKELTIERNGYTASGLTGANNYVMEETTDKYQFYLEGYTISTEQQNGDCTVTMTYHLSSDKNGMVMAACYGTDGRMLGVATAELVPAASGTMELVIHMNGQAATVKAFLVDNALIPLFASMEVTGN